MNILGINAYHGDVSAVLLRDGALVAAVEEERFRRVKHWAGFPQEAIRVCLEMAGITPEQVDHFAVSRDPKANQRQKALFVLRHWPSPRLILDRGRNRRQVQDVAGMLGEELGVRREVITGKVNWVEHHPAHLASTFFVSPFDEAAVCAIDGFGDFVSTSFGIGRGSRLEVFERVYFPHSLGLAYLAITQHLGFLKYGDEFKVMGLAPYGSPDYVEEIRRLIQLKPEGRFELDLTYFRHWSDGVSMTWDDGEPTMGQVYTPKIEQLLGPARKPEEPLTDRHEAIAASLQVVFEEAAFHVLNALYEKTRLPRLCLAGGCAMNSVMNGKIRERTPFKEVYIQPASGDNGTALGAALYVQHHVLGQPRRFVMEHGYWGPEFGDEEIGKVLGGRGEELKGQGCEIRKIEDEEELCRWTAERIAEGKIVGWFQGRMEWGPAPLGIGASWPIHGGLTCARSSTRRSSSGRNSDRLRLRCWKRRSTSTSSARSRIRSWSRSTRFSRTSGT